MMGKPGPVPQGVASARLASKGQADDGPATARLALVSDEDPSIRHRVIARRSRLPRCGSRAAPTLEQPVPSSLAPLQAETPVARAAASSLEDLLPAFVRRVAWSGDGRRGTMRLELGAGELAGATLLVHADAGRVRVELSLPPGGGDASGWRERIQQRLAKSNIPADAVEVT